MGEAGGREQKGEAAASGERRRLGSVCAVRWAQRDITDGTAVSPLSLCRHLDIHAVYPAVCSEARLAAGTKVLIARGGEGVGTPLEHFE